MSLSPVTPLLFLSPMLSFPVSSPFTIIPCVAVPCAVSLASCVISPVSVNACGVITPAVLFCCVSSGLVNPCVVVTPAVLLCCVSPSSVNLCVIVPCIVSPGCGSLCVIVPVAG